MNTSDDRRRYICLVGRAILLIMTILALAITGCDSSGTYQLTISSNAGGSVTVPGEGVFTYDVGTTVELVATPDNGYTFDEWAGDIDDIADSSSASTNITVKGDCSIAASFEEAESGPGQPY